MLLLFFMMVPGFAEKPERVLVLPFKNLGSPIYEDLSSKIALYANGFMVGNPRFTAFSLHEVTTVLMESGYSLRDIDRKDTVKMLSSRFNADIVIGGNYSEEKSEVLAYVSIEYLKKPEKNFNKLLKGNLQDHEFPSIDAILFPVFSQFAGNKLESAIISFMPDHPCDLSLNGEYFCESPVTLRLTPGHYEVSLAYNDKKEKRIVYERALPVENGKNELIKAAVFTRLTVDSPAQCRIMIDGEERGMTPFSGDLFSGEVYRLQVKYKDADSYECTVDDRLLSTVDMEPLAFSYDQKAVVRFSNNPHTLSGRLADGPFGQLPDSFDALEPGGYTLQIALPDPAQDTDWVLCEKSLKLHPFETYGIDCNEAAYRKNIWLGFLPSAAQFSSRQTAKAWTVLSLFTGAFIAGCVSFGLGWYYQDIYTGSLNRYNSEGLASGITPGDLANMRKPVDLSNIVLTVSIASLLAVYGYSLGDGILTMNHIDDLYRGAVGDH
jgi:hypothetical protein